MQFFRQKPVKSLEINELHRLAERAERARLGEGTRRRILAETTAGRRNSFVPRLAGLQWAAALGLLALLVAPSMLVRETASSLNSVNYPDDINLEVKLQDDGSVLLEWENGKSVHTVRRATSPVAVAEASPIRVEGSRFTDSDPSGAQIVYYQVD